MKTILSVYLKAVLLLSISATLIGADSHSHAVTFSNAKKIAQQIYQGHELTFYCGCKYQMQGKLLVPLLASCGYQVRKNNTRANRVEWEHVMPAWEFGHQLKCWQNGGRKNCRHDKNFNHMEGDLQNLMPAVGEVNSDRANFKYGMIPGEARQYGQCDFEIDNKAKIAEPRPAIRGDIARIYLYMADRYKLTISKKQRKLFESWSKEDPVDAWEIERDQRIANIQGNHNPYVSK